MRKTTMECFKLYDKNKWQSHFLTLISNLHFIFLSIYAGLERPKGVNDDRIFIFEWSMAL